MQAVAPGSRCGGSTPPLLIRQRREPQKSAGPAPRPPEVPFVPLSQWSPPPAEARKIRPKIRFLHPPHARHGRVPS